MKAIYIINDVNCGNIGVFGNMKLAYDFVAKRQLEFYGSDDLSSDLEISYSKMCSELRGTVNYQVNLDFEGDVTITCLELNRTDY